MNLSSLPAVRAWQSQVFTPSVIFPRSLSLPILLPVSVTAEYLASFPFRGLHASLGCSPFLCLFFFSVCTRPLVLDVFLWWISRTDLLSTGSMIQLPRLNFLLNGLFPRFRSHHSSAPRLSSFRLCRNSGAHPLNALLDLCLCLSHSPF